MENISDAILMIADTLMDDKNASSIIEKLMKQKMMEKLKKESRKLLII